jgi:hypothetical protein
VGTDPGRGLRSASVRHIRPTAELDLDGGSKVFDETESERFLSRIQPDCPLMIGSAVVAQGGTFELASSLREALEGPVHRLPPGSRIYVACGYVLCQSGAVQIAGSVAASLLELAEKAGSVRTMIVDAALTRCQAKTVVRLLSDGPVRLQHRKDTLTVDLRSPRLDDDSYAFTARNSTSSDTSPWSRDQPRALATAVQR